MPPVASRWRVKEDHQKEKSVVMCISIHLDPLHFNYPAAIRMELLPSFVIRMSFADRQHDYRRRSFDLRIPPQLNCIPCCLCSRLSNAKLHTSTSTPRRRPALTSCHELPTCLVKSLAHSLNSAEPTCSPDDAARRQRVARQKRPTFRAHERVTQQGVRDLPVMSCCQ